VQLADQNALEPMTRIIANTTKRKRRGDSGKPCQRPLSTLKKGEADPFIITTKEVVVIQHITHLIKSIPKPRCVKRSLM
jgi:hypothetical protein